MYEHEKNIKVVGRCSGGGSDGGSSGGGFGGSPSGICSVDLDYDAYCDSVWYQNGTTRYADQVAYARVLGPINLPCNPTTLSPEQSFCTFNLAAQFGVSTVFSAGMDVNTPLGNVDLGVEVSGSISVGLSREDIKVARGYIDTYTIEKSGTRYSGQYTFAYYDKYDNYFQQVTTGFSYSGTKASGYWEKVIWRYMYPAKPLSRKVW